MICICSTSWNLKPFCSRRDVEADLEQVLHARREALKNSEGLRFVPNFVWFTLFWSVTFMVVDWFWIVVLKGRDSIELNLLPGKDCRPWAEGWTRHGDGGHPHAIKQLQEVQGLGFHSSEISICLELFLQPCISQISEDLMSSYYIYFIWYIMVVWSWLQCILYCHGRKKEEITAVDDKRRE